MEYKHRKYKCQDCGFVRSIKTNHCSQVYRQPFLNINKYPVCKIEKENYLTSVGIWECIETKKI
jgi:hypothetical protein